ncbi:MAG: tRNA threonylcarbamoyladenosine dehydratase [Bacilli bacterium]|jgi:tRNA A37 threonylcarbamoyladenosine dehydratase
MDLSRLEKILDKKIINKIKNTTVLVIGIGGVGSYAIEALARSGIGTLIIVDHDIVESSNINRQLIALNSTIGFKKVDVMKQRILDINPNCKVIALDLFIDKDTIKEILKYQIDYVVDAIDTITSKKLIIKECLKNNIDFISAMGTGNRFDPTKLTITDIRKTSYDPIAKIIRKMVKDERIKDKIMVVSSNEKPVKLNDRIPGSNSFVPSTAGLLCASYIINQIKKS